MFGRAEDTLAENAGKDLTGREGKRRRERLGSGVEIEEKFVTRNGRDGSEIPTPKICLGGILGGGGTAN
jgi:hypothetical protein